MYAIFRIALFFVRRASKSKPRSPYTSRKLPFGG